MNLLFITPLFAIAVSGQSLLMALFWVLVAAVVFFLLQWLVGQIAPREPFAYVAKVIIAVFVVVCLLNAVFTIVGKPFISW